MRPVPSTPPPEGAFTGYRELVRFARELWRHSPRRTAKALAFQLLGGVTEGVSILLLLPILGFLEMPAAGGGGGAAILVPDLWFLPGLAGARLEFLWVLVALVAVLSLLAVFNRYRTLFVADLLQGFVNRVRSGLFEALARARWSMVAHRRAADLNHVLTSEIDRLQLCAVSALALVQLGIVQVVYLCVSLAISPAMTAFAGGVGTLVLLGLHPLRKRAHAFGLLLSQNRREQYRTVTDFLAGMKIAKSYNVEEVHVARLGETLRRVQADNLRFNRVATLANTGFQIGSALALAIFIFLAVEHVALPLAEIVVLLLVFMRLAPRFMEMQVGLQQLLSALPAFETTRALREEFEAEREEGGSGPAPALVEVLRLRSVSFTYPGAEGAALTDITFDIPRGQVTALIGPSGAGKSTLVDLALGLTEPSAGEIRVDDEPLSRENRRAWRARVAYVPQEPFLFHASIAANLRLAHPGATMEELRAALSAAQALRFVDALPEGMETIVGDRGTRLSGGERQRVALARALLRTPDLLILDEATSALDQENQALVAQAIAVARGRLTVLMIAHSPKMIEFADFVVALEAGRLKETGRFDVLARDRHTALGRMMEGN
ncbi:ABC transporter ATP-binding protein [Aureimonas populi]|uniref:ABC transporter ATP-binding protein n=1 Tax=Aureimonas populi TaxID=1701758 RepID=A0ABW5CR14_9HYPH|nr:ABC transporter ATP-binding protein [Aureimonas populi]